MILPCIIFFFYIGFDLSSSLWTSPEYNCMVKTAKRYLQSLEKSGGCSSAILFPLVPREARQFNTCVFCVLSSRGPFQPMKRSENCLFPRGRFHVKEDASFYFKLKSFSCQVQQEVFLTLVSDVFLNLSFDLPVLPPLSRI